MKKFLLLSLIFCFAGIAYADYTGPGYYRIKNYKTSRVASLIDNKGHIDFANTTADLQAIKLQKDYDRVCCDPATILYLSNDGIDFDIEAQGTGIYQIVERYINIKEDGKEGAEKLYKAYGEMNGVVKYLGDSQAFPRDLGSMGTNASGNYTKWYITPLDENDEDNFFGVRPTLSVNGKHYLSMLGSFPFSVASPGVKAYYVKEYTPSGVAELAEITGNVPASTPVIFECESENPSDNRLHIGSKDSEVNDNFLTFNNNNLKGVYFCNSTNGHINRTAYSKNSMRVLGTCKDGSLGFVTAENLDYIPANTCYITVPGWAEKEIKIVFSHEEYMAGIEDIAEDPEAPKDVYNIHGQPMLRNALPDQINSLPAGIYIVGGKKLVIK